VKLAPLIEALRADLQQLAAVGDDPTAQAAQRLSAALGSSVGMRILDALGQASVELNAQLPAGRVEVRLAGQDPELVFVDEEGGTISPAFDDELNARVTLRLPEGLKGRLEEAASREGVSLNTWLVRALARAVEGDRTGPRPPRVGKRLTGYGKS
jgi:hypothetical protein